MKKITSLFLCTIMFLTVSVSTVLGADLSIKLDGKTLQTDPAPVVVDGRTLVPLRSIFEALNVTLNWDAAKSTITSTKGDTTVILVIGKTTATRNGKDLTLDVAPQIVQGRTMVPLRFVAEAYDATVSYDATTNVVSINSSKALPTPQDILPLNTSRPLMPTMPPKLTPLPLATSSPISKNLTKTENGITLTSPVSDNEEATLIYTGKANTKYSISIYYSSGASKASGLEDNTSNANGVVSWTWKIGAKTSAGDYKIDISDSTGKVAETTITVQ